MSIVVKTLDNKMLQETFLGVIITPRRPHLLASLTPFLETRLSTRHDATSRTKIPPEAVIILDEAEVPDVISDAEFGAAWNQLLAEKKLDTEFYKNVVLSALALAVSTQQETEDSKKLIREGGNVKVSATTGEADSKKVVVKKPLAD
jgi:hypothetical protein